MRWCVMVLCLGCAVDAHAQRIIHDPKRDATAQEAVTTAKDITSGSLFDTMLRNVDAQAKLEADVTLAGVEQGSGLDQILVIYHAVRDIWAGSKAVSVPPASLRPLQEQLDLRLLAVETDYLKARTRIEARRHLEVNDALNLVHATLLKLHLIPADNEPTANATPQKTFLFDSTDEIETTLRRAAKDGTRERLTTLLLVLHDTSAAIARMDAAGALAEMRAGDEQRRYAIRVSTVNASTYDATIQAAVARLALYWKGGVKPADLAQLAFYLTNTIAIPAIAIKQ